MKGDFSRLTFDSKKNYSSVRMQQGRVQLDADWNEQVDITEHRIEKLFTDLIGQSGTPTAEGNGFEISIKNNNRIKISNGHIYVAGLLCENAENAKGVSFTCQPNLPEAQKYLENNANTDGTYLAYLDVWQRLVTSLEDPDIREPALGGADTAARSKNVWQVKLVPMVDASGNPDVNETIKGLNAISTGKMNAHVASGRGTTARLPRG